MLLQRVAPERFAGQVDLTLLPRERRQDDNHRRGDSIHGPPTAAPNTGQNRPSRADDQGDDTDDGHELVMVRHQGVAQEVDVEEAQHGRQRDDVIAQREQYGAPEALAVTPRQKQHGEQGQGWEIGDPLARVDLPPRIDEAETKRQNRLVDVEADDPSGTDQPFQKGIIAHHVFADRSNTLKVDLHQAHGRGDGEERHAAQQVAPADPPVQPPRA